MDVGLPWQSSGYDSVLPLRGVWVLSLVGKLHMLHGMAKKTKNKQTKPETASFSKKKYCNFEKKKEKIAL